MGPYLVLERLEGEDLGSLAPLGQPLDPERVISYAVQICEALAAAHAVDIIHRDIKPSNIFLAKTAAGPTVKVLDFGVSKVSPGDGQGSLTRDGPLGSPQFISPEQLENPRAVDARTDIWALGVVMYRLLSGTFPFNGKTVAETFALVAKGDRAPLRDVAPAVPASLAAVVERCLARDPKDRYASASDVRDALERRAEAAPAASPPASARSTVTRPPRPWVVLVAGFAVTLGIGGAVLALKTRPVPAATSAEAAPTQVPIASAEIETDAGTLTEVPATSVARGHSPATRPQPHPRKKPDPVPSSTELRSNPYR